MSSNVLSRASARAGCTLLSLLVAGAVLAENRKLLVSTVEWVDTQGHNGTMLFQGTVDDAVLTGNAYAGASALDVSGTISANGTLTGTLNDHETGAVIGTFSATLNAAMELEGVLAVDGELNSVWNAPATELSTP
jgi:hypothetical protein